MRRLVSYATPLMRELAETSQQANQLVVFDRGSAVVIAQQEAPGYWGISIRVGSHISLFDTGSGHVLLAFRSQEERQMMIAEHVTQHREAGASAEFFTRLDQIRDRGYEMMALVQTAGVFNLSAPVLGSDGKAIAALTIPYITAGQRAVGARHHQDHRAVAGDRGKAVAAGRVGRRSSASKFLFE